jgi:hypothetical protein
MDKKPGERTPADEKHEQSTYDSFPDVTPRRISGDDSLEASSPVDNRSDEKVIANEPAKTRNAPSQTSAYISGVRENDDDFSDDHDRKESV